MFSYRVISAIFLVLCMIFTVILGAMIYIARVNTDRIIDDLSTDRVIASKTGFDSYLANLSDDAMRCSATLARQQRLINAIKEYNESGIDIASGDEQTNKEYETGGYYTSIYSIINEFLYGYDFISIADKNGIALARTDTGEREYPLPKFGYNLMANPDVVEVFKTGEPVSALTFMLDNTTLVATTLYPIKENDEILGVVIVFFDLTNPRHIMGYQQQSGSQAAIFLRQEDRFYEFISTFNFTEPRVRIQAHDQVIDAILNKGEELYISFDKIGNTTYGTAFAPLIYHGEIIGMLFTGVDVNSAIAISVEMDTIIWIIGALTLVIVLTFILIIRRYNAMIHRQMATQSLITRISQSFLSDEDTDTLVNRAFYELGPHMRVSLILLYRAKIDEDTKFICTNEWMDSSLNLPTYLDGELPVSPAVVEAYANMPGADGFYISSDNKKLRKAIEPYRKHFKNFLTTAIYVDDKLYAVVDFSRARKREKWRREDINTASLLSSVLTGAFHRKQVEEQLVAAKELAEQSSNYKSAFLANVSHEIRTPMNAILGIAEIYMQDKSARSNLDEGLNMIYESGNLLLGIINDILDLSKIEAGKMEIFPTRYDISSLIFDTVQLCRMRYGSKPIEFMLDIDKNTPLNLVGDEIRIRQILNNILSNAFKYTESGSIKMSVSADTVNRDEHQRMYIEFDGSETVKEGSIVTLIFRVSDTGQGMNKEQLGMLFDEFSRFNMEINSNVVGTGLGMSITKQLVDLMHGAIHVESEQGVGSTFTVRIPQERVDNATCGPELSAALNNFHHRSISLTKKAQIVYEYMPYGSVLVVDDVESNLYVAKGMLIPYGLKITTAASGYEAIEHIAGGKQFDVILMDHMMPKKDGVETVRDIREMGYDGCIIALTANALVGQREMFLENGFNGYIPKPVDTRELNTILIENIRNKKPPEVVNAAREEAREAELLRTLATAPASPEVYNPGGDAGEDEAMNEVIRFFIGDAERALEVLEEANGKIIAGKDIDINEYRITAHGIKSALRHVGEKDLSGAAHTLEQAAIDHDFDTIKEKTAGFITAIREVVERLTQQQSWNS